MRSSSQALADCIPMDRRLTPALRRIFRDFTSTLSGLHSTVTSASFSTLKLADHAQQLFKPLGPVVAGGAAADVDGVHREVLGQGAVSLMWASSAF